MKQIRRPAVTLSLVLIICTALLNTACPKTTAEKAQRFAKGVRLISAMVVPLVDSQIASGAITADKAKYIKDGSDLAFGTATLADELSVCADKACGLDAVDKFQATFFEIAGRGNFIKVERLARVQSLIEGLLASARVYFGAAAKRGESYRPIDELLKELEKEMRPTVQGVNAVGFIPCAAPRYSYRPECDPVEIHPCSSTDIAHNAHQVDLRPPPNCK